MTRRNRRPKRRLNPWLVLWTLLLTGGATLILYPTVADWFVIHAQAGEVARHTHSLEELSASEAEWLLADAHTYNHELFAGRAGRTDEHTPEYRNLLRPEGSEVLSLVAIPSIEVTLPVFHGTSEEVLNRAVGHQYGTSLPVGGLNTHSVITAHSGWVSARLFNDLDQLVVGDLFYLTTAGQTIFYEVDQIVVVLPGEYQDYLEIVPGRDLVTLFTCTPTGVNTHRLLVRGTRVPPPSGFDLDSYEATMNAGFPHWAAIIAAVFVVSSASGRWMFRPPAAAPAGGTLTPAHSAARGTRPPARHAAARKANTSKKGRHQA
ncbi:MAG: class C sortase [Promicromonosporaceae bacterium]|nr:class C sortase [Promicromonosporaceae bacterium]